MTRATHGTAGGLALSAALVTVLVSLVLAGAMAEVSRTEVLLTRMRRVAAAALAAADACLAESVASLPPGWDFGTVLAGSDGVPGTADDGLLALPAGCAARAVAAPGAAAPPRLRLTVDGRASEGRRTLEGLVGRSAQPGLPVLGWLSELPAPGAVTGALLLDGADRTDPGAPPAAGLAAPADPASLDAWLAGEATRVTVTAGTGLPIASAPPPLAALATRTQAMGPAGPETLVPAGTPSPVVAFVASDLVVGDALSGAGLLVVTGTLDIRGALHFTGVVVAAGGVRIAGGARLAVDGALWAGKPSVAGPSVVVDGLLELHQDRAAVGAADALLPLPRPAMLLGVRDVG